MSYFIHTDIIGFIDYWAEIQQVNNRKLSDVHVLAEKMHIDWKVTPELAYQKAREFIKYRDEQIKKGQEHE